MLFKQGMPGGFEVEQVGTEVRRHAIVIAGKTGAGQQAVNQCQDARTLNKRSGVATHLAGERDKDAMNLGLLFFDEADQLVVLLDGFERLDVDRLAGGTGAVDDAGDAPLELAAHGNDEAVAADGDEVFLGGAVAGKLAQGGAEATLR